MVIILKQNLDTVILDLFRWNGVELRRLSNGDILRRYFIKKTKFLQHYSPARLPRKVDRGSPGFINIPSIPIRARGAYVG